MLTFVNYKGQPLPPPCKQCATDREPARRP